MKDINHQLLNLGNESSNFFEEKIILILNEVFPLYSENGNVHPSFYWNAYASRVAKSLIYYLLLNKKCNGENLLSLIYKDSVGVDKFIFKINEIIKNEESSLITYNLIEFLKFSRITRNTIYITLAENLILSLEKKRGVLNGYK